MTIAWIGWLAIVAAPEAAEPVPPPAQASDFAWMVGTWEGEGFGAQLMESYAAPTGGQMPGFFRIVKDGRPTLYEFVMIAEVGGSLEYRVRHVNPDMTAWEEKDKFVRFPLVKVEPDRWTFDGLVIERTSPDSTRHVLTIKHKDGTISSSTLTYKRLKRDAR